MEKIYPVQPNRLQEVTTPFMVITFWKVLFGPESDYDITPQAQELSIFLHKKCDVEVGLGVSTSINEISSNSSITQTHQIKLPRCGVHIHGGWTYCT